MTDQQKPRLRASTEDEQRAIADVIERVIDALEQDEADANVIITAVASTLCTMLREAGVEVTVRELLGPYTSGRGWN